MKLLVQAIFLMYGAVASAQNLPCLVDSTNHGGGLFTYTFRRGDAPYVWALGANQKWDGGTIVFQSCGVLDVQEPPGWTHSISPCGLITLSVTAGPGYLDEPLVFSVLSCLTESGPYSGIDGGGHIIGVVVALPGRTNYLGGGYQIFDYVGPALPRLSVLRDGTNVIVRWSGEAQGLQLEGSERLGVLNAWSSVTNLPTVIDGEFTVTLRATNSQRFFRLVSPCTR